MSKTKQTFNILTTELVAKHIAGTVRDLRTLLDTKKREKQQLELSGQSVKDTLRDLRDEWKDFDKADANGLIPLKVVDHLTGEVLIEASKARASKTYDVSGFIREWLTTVGYTAKQAENCLTTLEESGLLEVLSLGVSNMTDAQLAVLGNHQEVEHTGARTYK